LDYAATTGNREQQIQCFWESQCSKIGNRNTEKIGTEIDAFHPDGMVKMERRGNRFLSLSGM